MSDQNNSELEKFEKRFANAWFSAGWAEIEPKVDTKVQKTETMHKDLTTLQAEIEQLNNAMEAIAQKQLRLANLAQFYTN